jgi:hypothetical protein
MNKSIYKNLINKLLEQYNNKSSQSNELYRFIVYRTTDDNLCLFEKLSINNQIGIYTNLSDFDCRILLFILLTLFEKNYNFYKKSFIQDVLYDSDITNEDFGLDEMLTLLKNNYMDLNKWVEYLKLIPLKVDLNDNINKLNDYINEYGTDIDNLQIYKDLPEVSKYFKLNHHQNFYTLNELYNL